MRFSMLGPLQIGVGGHELTVAGPKQRALLLFLLLHRNEVVSSDRIIDALWGEESTEREDATLRVHISHLRSALEPDRPKGSDPTVLVTEAAGYVLKVEPDDVDVDRFERLTDEGRSVMADDPGSAADLLGTAIELWRGEPLEDVAYEEFAQLEIRRLTDLRQAATEDLLEARLAAGDHHSVLTELEAMLREHPLRERLYELLMLAQYRSGRQADALRLFQRAERVLGEELGTEPSPQLRRLEEQILLHDPRLEPPERARGASAGTAPLEATNPFKGLRAFVESDADRFVGRDRVVAEVLRHISKGDRLVTLVGASGSGKSSVVRAGLIPALRKGALAGSDAWYVAQMTPGALPFAELEAALLHSTIDAPDSLGEQLEGEEAGLLRAVLRVLPTDSSRLVLLIDQFEELFTLVSDEEVRQRFLANLGVALDDPRGRLVVVLTLRADFYDRPLEYPDFGNRIAAGVVNVTPMTLEELEAAAREPAATRGVSVEPALLATLLTDVAGQVGALPLYQYTLTELFDRRVGDRLTAATYRDLGGVNGALSRRADDLYLELEPEQKKAARQLFLRLVTIGDADEWSRRRVPASEIVSLDVDLVAAQGVIELFTAHRLLTVDRDYVTGSPTVEVAHEALLTEWGWLRGWIEESREDVKRHAALTAAMNEWIESDRHPDFLLTGSRLVGYEQWAATATMQLSVYQQRYLDAAVEWREDALRLEVERSAHEEKTERAARRRLWGLVAAVALVVGLGVGLLVLVYQPEPVRVAVVAPSTQTFGTVGLLETGIANAESELGVEVELLSGPFTSRGGQYRELAEAGTDLIFIDPDNSGWGYVDDVIADYPDTAFAVIDGTFPPAGAESVYFADEEGGYVAGIAAALATETGVVGFVGGHQSETTERWRAGYEAGAHAIDPDIEIVATYVSTESTGIKSVTGGKAAAGELYQRNADVVFALSGNAARHGSRAGASEVLNLGVIEAAWEQTRDTGVHRWAIGSDSDWSVGVAAHLRPHVLTSAIQNFDVAILETIRAFTEGGFAPGVTVLTLADGAVGLALSGHLTENDKARIDELSTNVAAGVVPVPRAPVGELLPPPGVNVSHTVTVTWDGETCSYMGSMSIFDPLTTIRIDFVNLTPDYREFRASRTELGTEVSTLVRPMASNTGYITLQPGNVALECLPEIRRSSPEVSDSLVAEVLTVEPS